MSSRTALTARATWPSSSRSISVIGSVTGVIASVRSRRASASSPERSAAVSWRVSEVSRPARRATDVRTEREEAEEEVEREHQRSGEDHGELRARGGQLVDADLQQPVQLRRRRGLQRGDVGGARPGRQRLQPGGELGLERRPGGLGERGVEAGCRARSASPSASRCADASATRWSMLPSRLTIRSRSAVRPA